MAISTFPPSTGGSGTVTSIDITPGTGISATGGPITTNGSITVTNTAPDQIVSLTQGGTTTITGTYPNFTISSADQYSGTVTSVGGTGTVNGITLTGTVTSSGSLTLGGTLSGVDLTTQVSGTLPAGNGGTGTNTAFTAGSVVFAGATGVYGQDNANLFWDNSNKRLGIGTTTPGFRLDVQESTGTMQVKSTTGTNQVYMTLNNTAGNFYIARDSSTGSGFGLGNYAAVIWSDGNYPMVFATNGTERMRLNGTGGLTLSTALTVGNGGTGVTTTPANGQLLIGNGTNYTVANLTQGADISITNAAGSITIASSYALSKSTSVFTSGTAATFTAPASTEWVKITVVGPGGNGGAANNQRATGGGGGGVAIKWVSMTPGQTLTYTVGTASGTASTVSSGTLVISTITANSGANGAGTAYANSITAGAAGGTATGGDVNITGGQGGHSYGSGNTVGTNFSGKGGDCPGFGSGGSALALVATAGVQGNGFGCGGGGAHGNNTAANGRGGIIIFETY